MRETFGLDIAIGEEEARALTHFPSMRNAAVHDQGLFELRLDVNGNVTAREKACPRHPTGVTGEDVFAAAKAYAMAAATVGISVMTQCLKCSAHPALAALKQLHATAGLSADAPRTQERGLEGEETTPAAPSGK